MRRTRIAPLILVGLVVIVGTASTAFVGAQTSIPTQAPVATAVRRAASVAATVTAVGSVSQTRGVSNAIITPPPNQVPPPGVPAIAPRSVTASVVASQPAFTAVDVINYFSRGNKLAGSSASGPVVVQSVEFLTTAQVNSRLNTKLLNQPMDKLLCLVQLSGSFSHEGPPGTTPQALRTIYQVFDARTGNLLSEIGGA